MFRSAHFGAVDNPGVDLVKAETKEVELVHLYSNLCPGPDSMHKLLAKAAATLRSCESTPCRQHQVRLYPHQAHALAIAYRAGKATKELAALFGIHRKTVTAVPQRFDSL